MCGTFPPRLGVVVGLAYCIVLVSRVATCEHHVARAGACVDCNVEAVVEGVGQVHRMSCFESKCTSLSRQLAPFIKRRPFTRACFCATEGVASTTRMDAATVCAQTFCDSIDGKLAHSGPPSANTYVLKAPHGAACEHRCG